MPLIIIALLSFMGFFVLLTLLFLPFHFLLFSLYNLLTIPWQLIKITTNSRLRQNHALEHATVNVLQERYGVQKAAGMARENGFILQAQVPPEAVEISAREGLARMQKGENHLRIHSRCGTSIMASNFLAALIFLFLLWNLQFFTLFNIILAVAVAYLLGPLLGRVLQFLFTTSPRVDNLEITGVQMAGAPGLWGGVLGVGPGKYLVRTSRIGVPRKVSIDLPR